MNRVPVTSSNVSSIGWEASKDDPQVGTLEVQFRSGGTYQYQDVPESAHLELMGAQSIGRHLNQAIINVYTGNRIR
jgi:KTSC domain